MTGSNPQGRQRKLGMLDECLARVHAQGTALVVRGDPALAMLVVILTRGRLSYDRYRREVVRGVDDPIIDLTTGPEPPP